VAIIARAMVLTLALLTLPAAVTLANISCTNLTPKREKFPMII
jgi:hypothetical protein